jgi:hypothetical protein
LAPACNGSEIIIVATVLKSPAGVNVSVCGAASDRLPGRAAESHLSAGLARYLELIDEICKTAGSVKLKLPSIFERL